MLKRNIFNQTFTKDSGRALIASTPKEVRESWDAGEAVSGQWVCILESDVDNVKEGFLRVVIFADGSPSFFSFLASEDFNYRNLSTFFNECDIYPSESSSSSFPPYIESFSFEDETPELRNLVIEFFRSHEFKMDFINADTH